MYLSIHTCMHCSYPIINSSIHHSVIHRHNLLSGRGRRVETYWVPSVGWQPASCNSSCPRLGASSLMSAHIRTVFPSHEIMWCSHTFIIKLLALPRTRIWSKTCPI